MNIRRYAAAMISAVTAFVFTVNCFAEETPQKEQPCYVLMETTTKTVLRQRDGTKRVHMGSFNKLMTVLLAAEAVENGALSFETMLTCSEHANSMQGAQIWLSAGERMSLSDLMKAVIIGNANDAACVIAESVGGSEEKFTGMMNSRASELGMKDTLFTNPNGYYDDDMQYTTPCDAALLLCELSEHDELREMFTSRLDELKDGEVLLVTTNTLCHRYKGSVGFKCGSGPNSRCYAAEGAVCDGFSCVSAVFDCDDEDASQALAKELMDIAFDGFSVISPAVPVEMPERISSVHGVRSDVRLSVEPSGDIVVPKGKADCVEAVIILPEYAEAPCFKGDKAGELRYFLDGEILRCCDVFYAEDNEAVSVNYILCKMLKFAVSF